MIFTPRFALVCFFFGCVLSVLAADPWAYFHAKNVIQFGCSISDIELSHIGEPSVPKWEATAKAKRKGEQDWAMTVGMYPSTLKGRHEAEKACSRWMDQAQARVKAGKR